MKHAVQVVVRPVISEKSYAAMGQGQYVFRVASAANKVEIKAAVAAAFKVTPVAVNVLTVKGKTRVRSRGRQRITGRTSDWKKAVVTLAPGESIPNLFEGV
ncbi:MAG TPA: 50S ribosomal protein L23 [Verrucomicrobiae bacterium]|nr:50S ribosomal protein L23 [Verrucomicrobiae bacterium]